MALLTALVAASPASASTPSYRGSSLDGKIVFFETSDKLVSGDTDGERDVYERSYDEDVDAYVTREVSLGPVGGNDAYPALYERASASGQRVFFSTREQLVSADSDARSDVYMRDLGAGTTVLISRGSPCLPECGNGAFDAGFAGASADGARAFFVTEEQLSPLDTDRAMDVYERDAEGDGVSLVSVGDPACAPCGNGDFDATPWAVSPDGSMVFFTTAEALVDADGDSVGDIYSRDLSSGETSLVSVADPACSACGGEQVEPVYRGSSADGERVFFTTEERLVAADEDAATDVYARDLPGGPTRLVSAGDSGSATANFAAASLDGSRVFVTTAAPLAGEDDNGAADVYVWSGGAPALVSPGECVSAGACGSSFEAAAGDGAAVLFTTAQRLSPQDGDDSPDIYEQALAGGSPVLVSAASAACAGCDGAAEPARFDGAAADASRVIFSSRGKLAEGDHDGSDDIYVWDLADGETTLVTPAGHCPVVACDATFVDASADNARIFFQTPERLTLDDGDEEIDIYERAAAEGSGSGEVTRLVSSGNAPGLQLGPPAPLLLGTDPASPGESGEPRVLGQATGGAAVKVYATGDCSGEPVATGSAEELADPGLPVAVEPGATARLRATAELDGFVSPCSAEISYRRLSPPAPPVEEGGPGGGGGSPGAAGPPPASAPSAPEGGGGGSSAPAAELAPAAIVPRVSITFAPAAKTRSRRPVFRFAESSGQEGMRFRCRIDRHRWRNCVSPLRSRRLARGRHVFRVRAVVFPSRLESRPAIRRFRVVRR